MQKSSTANKRAPLPFSELEGSLWLGNADKAWLEEQLKQYQEDPSKVDPKLSQLLEKIEAGASWSEISHQDLSVPRPGNTNVPAATSEKSIQSHPISLVSLIKAFRTYGHLQAKVDPLGLSTTPEVSELTLKAHHLDGYYQTASLPLHGQARLDQVTPEQALKRLKEIYCGSIGFEFEYIVSQEQRHWLSEKIEGYTAINTPETKKRILRRLVESDGVEKHLAAQFVGQKRFSIEGADSLIPMLDTLTIAAKVQGVTSVNLGMPHRGRLTVLMTWNGKAPQDIFEEFSGKYSKEDTLSGDVKYHKGFKSQLKTAEGIIDVELAFNPSHLEIVNSVLEGMTRAKQDQIQDTHHAERQVLPILVHGDAAFAGQGVVMETLQLSQVLAYKTGGTIHIILNNQVGFTTNPEKARSSRYCSDIGKMIEAPVFHVNGNDPEAACRAIDLALGFRNTFQKDVIIDLVCYRRYGHNEADEPAATQPIMYKKIRAEGPVWTLYAKQLEKEKIIEKGEAQAWLNEYRKRVSLGEPVAPLAVKAAPSNPFVNSQDWRIATNTQVDLNTLKSFEKPLTDLPEEMSLQPQVSKLMTDRKKMIQGSMPLNWGAAETLAYASLLSDGFNIRLTGQDAERGTFAHRHSVLHDYHTGKTYTPLATLSKKRQQFTVYDSILSEMATMGFEYGYSVVQPNALVIWEAQYGDFVNGSQIVIDQFLTAGEQKWGQLNNLVLFLPHGYEGAGPEHSSARLERFLQACAQDNIQVCAPTTPAQHFHLLRRQVLRSNYQKPLVIMTPKSLLRHKQATSELSELSQSSFQPIIGPTETQNPEKIERIILCSGKVYYDLMAAQSDNNLHTVVIRVEQLYPFPDQELIQILKAYPHASQVMWCQEEPKNQGAWQWVRARIEGILDKQTLSYVGRPEAAATAVGSPLRHAAEQKKLVQEALG